MCHRLFKVKKSPTSGLTGSWSHVQRSSLQLRAWWESLCWMKSGWMNLRVFLASPGFPSTSLQALCKRRSNKEKLFFISRSHKKTSLDWGTRRSLRFCRHVNTQHLGSAPRAAKRLWHSLRRVQTWPHRRRPWVWPTVAGEKNSELLCLPCCHYHPVSLTSFMQPAQDGTNSN